LGTSSPSTLMHLKDSADTYLTLQAGAADGNDGILFKNSAGTQKGVILFDTDNDYMLFSTNDTERMRIDSSGNVGVGKSSNLFYRLTFAEGSGDASRIGWVSGSGNRKASIDCGNTAAIVFRTNTADTERMRIDSSGNVLVAVSNTTKTSEGFRIENGGQPNITRGTDGTFISFYHTSGSVIGSIQNNGGTGTLFNTSSDYRLKENVVDIADGITRVKQLSPRRFNFIADATRTVDGFIAHEAQAVVPEAVTGTHDEVDADGNAVMQGIDQSKLVPLLTAALQEAIAKIETLETKVAALEAG